MNYHQNKRKQFRLIAKKTKQTQTKTIEKACDENIKAA